MGLSKSSHCWRIPDELWAKIQPLLPPGKPHPLGCHRPRVDDRKAMDAIFYRLRTRMSMESARCHRDLFKQQRPSAFSGMDPSRCFSAVMGARSTRLRGVGGSGLGMASDGWSDDQSAPWQRENRSQSD